MAGYIRQSLSQIQDGQIVNAAPINAEYNTLEAAFSSVSGHKHDGSASEGAPITTIGPTQNVNATSTDLYPRVDNTVSLGTLALQFKDLFIKGISYLRNTIITGTLSVSTSVTTPTVVASVGTNGFTFTGLGEGVKSPATGTVEVVSTSGNKVAVSASGTAVTGPVTVSGTSTLTGITTLSNGVRNSNGTISAPSYSFTSENNTGLYRKAASNVAVSINGTDRLSISPSQVEVGATTLQVPSGTVTTPGIGFVGDANTGLWRASEGAVAFVSNGVVKGVFDEFRFGTVGTTPLNVGEGAWLEYEGLNAFAGVVVVPELTSTGTELHVRLPLEDPQMFWLIPLITNTGNMIMRVGGGTAQSLRTPTGGVLPAGYLTDGDGPVLFKKLSGGGWAVYVSPSAGTTADGYWQKSPSGLLTCTQTVAVGDVTTAAGSLFTSAAQAWTFPQPFATSLLLTVTGSVESSTGRYFGLASTGPTSCQYRVVNTSSSTAATNVRLTATGRWFT